MRRRIRKWTNKYRNLSNPLKASLWFAICTFMQKGISVLTTPIFTRLLSADEYGLFSLYMSWSDILSIFITFGLSSAVYQKKLIQLESQKEQNQLTSSLQGLATVTAACALLIYFVNRSWINPLLGLPTGMVVSIFIGVLSTTAFGFWAMQQRVHYQYKRLVALTLFTSVMKPTMGIVGIFLFPDNKVVARVYALVAVEVVAYIYLYVKQFLIGKKFLDWESWKYALSFVIPLIPHYISQRILSQSDRIMINDIVGTDAAGIYSLAHSVGWLTTMIITAVDATLAPWTYKKLKERNVKRLKQFSVYPMLFMGAICIAFISFAPELVRIFADAEYHDAIWIVPPLVMSTYFMMFYTMLIYLEYYYEKTKLVMAATIASAGLNVLLNYIFIHLFGYFAAAYTSLVCYIFYLFFHYMVFRKVCKEQFGGDVYNIRLMVLISAGFLITSFALMLFYELVTVRMMIVLVIIILAFIKRKKILQLIKSIKASEQL